MDEVTRQTMLTLSHALLKSGWHSFKIAGPENRDFLTLKCGCCSATTTINSPHFKSKESRAYEARVSFRENLEHDRTCPVYLAKRVIDDLG